MCCAIVMAYYRVTFPGAGEAVCCVKLVICPPTINERSCDKQENHNGHASSQNGRPMHPASAPWRSSVVNNNLPVALTDHLRPLCRDISPCAGWHARSFFWIVQIISQVKRVVRIALSLCGNVG